MTWALSFEGNPAPLTDADVAEAAAMVGLTPAHIAAVKAVESRGRGFEGDRPIILFEPHVFSRETGGRFDRTHGGVSYPKWGMKPYRNEQADRYDQLTYAMRLDRTAALRSASWGLFQIMGFNHEAAGFSDVELFVKAHVASEREQLLAFCRFIRTNGYVEALRREDWATFARRYNGPGYKKHAYHTKLAAAFTAAQNRSPA